MFSKLLLPLYALAGLSTASVVSQKYLHKEQPTDEPSQPQIHELLSGGCEYGLNVTMSVAEVGHITHNNGRLRVTKNGKPTPWRLEKRDAKDSWYIYYQHPAGNKHYWSGLSGEEVYISNTPQEIKIKYALTETGTPSVAIYWDEYCFRVREDDGRVLMNWNTQCENVIISPVASHPWESAEAMCQPPPSALGQYRGEGGDGLNGEINAQGTYGISSRGPSEACWT
ncbi:hypothetical protein GQ43DRAFT_475797 [Delitschia confertaspora ATCC 74209]|uniref:Uncharacterized protein n=1 Tax=Delitschia confertaspora ATCC 74209 TaxID=1513339 RepID=A0A9P4JIC2_9PLEO|nr:hypothetical protein GQ43DRAFT_475797 [Delitschia confertaspora ATCC 74209]